MDVARTTQEQLSTNPWMDVARTTQEQLSTNPWMMRWTPHFKTASQCANIEGVN